MTTDFETALEDFRACAELTVREHFKRNAFTFATPNVEIASRGKKYAKLVHTESDPTTGEKRGQTMVHSFVEIATGDIFKPASFKAPAKHARGNVFAEDHGRASMTDRGGIIYLK